MRRYCSEVGRMTSSIGWSKQSPILSCCSDGGNSTPLIGWLNGESQTKSICFSRCGHTTVSRLPLKAGPKFRQTTSFNANIGDLNSVAVGMFHITRRARSRGTRVRHGRFVFGDGASTAASRVRGVCTSTLNRKVGYFRHAMQNSKDACCSSIVDVYQRFPSHISFKAKMRALEPELPQG
ncbi:unnamed protein product, partial [Ectocarpus sp. 8 AP-2014]